MWRTNTVGINTMRTAIKFCGLNDVASVQAAVACQVDAFGFVFYAPSPRAVTLAQVQAFQSEIPPFVTRVGLLVNPDEAFVESIIASHCIDILQFHGQETGEFCEQFRFPYFKALPATPDVAESGYWAHLNSEYPSARAFLLDTPDPKLHGGTGRSFDWQHWPQASQKPLILAGGITANNVADAIAATKPYAVDVSSGIEISRGQKSAQKMVEFAAAVHKSA